MSKPNPPLATLCAKVARWFGKNPAPSPRRLTEAELEALLADPEVEAAVDEMLADPDVLGAVEDRLIARWKAEERRGDN